MKHAACNICPILFDFPGKTIFIVVLSAATYSVVLMYFKQRQDGLSIDVKTFYPEHC